MSCRCCCGQPALRADYVVLLHLNSVGFLHLSSPRPCVATRVSWPSWSLNSTCRRQSVHLEHDFRHQSLLPLHSIPHFFSSSTDRYSSYRASLLSTINCDSKARGQRSSCHTSMSPRLAAASQPTQRSILLTLPSMHHTIIPPTLRSHIAISSRSAKSRLRCRGGIPGIGARESGQLSSPYW